MNIVKKLLPFAMALTTAGCLSLDGVEIAGLGQSSGKLTKFRCDNGYKGSIKQRDNGVISMAFSDGKDSYVTYLNNQSSGSNILYVNDKKTLKWQEQQGRNTLTYPDKDYASTGKLSTTACQKY
ncbi:MliC family protein [Pasteurellaceae bacterium 22721_9_1]